MTKSHTRAKFAQRVSGKWIFPSQSQKIISKVQFLIVSSFFVDFEQPQLRFEEAHPKIARYRLGPQSIAFKPPRSTFRQHAPKNKSIDFSISIKFSGCRRKYTAIHLAGNHRFIEQSSHAKHCLFIVKRRSQFTDIRLSNAIHFVARRNRQQCASENWRQLTVHRQSVLT